MAFAAAAAPMTCLALITGMMVGPVQVGSGTGSGWLAGAAPGSART